MSGWMREWLKIFGNVALALAVIAVGELLPPLRAMEEWPAEERTRLVWLTGQVAFAGWLLLMGAMTYRVAVAGEFQDTVSVEQFKDAWRRQLWRSSLVWRVIFIMGFGAALMTFGIFGTIIVLGPAGVKLLAILALGYASVRTVWLLTRSSRRRIR